VLGRSAIRRILQLGVDAVCVVIVDVFSKKMKRKLRSKGLDDHEGIPPPRPKSAEGYPESPVSRGEWRTRLALSIDRELSPEGQFHDSLFSTRAEQRRQRGDEDGCVCDEASNHQAILNEGVREIESESRTSPLVASRTGDSASRGGGRVLRTDKRHHSQVAGDDQSRSRDSDRPNGLPRPDGIRRGP
jgi:hypothetical protein